MEAHLEGAVLGGGKMTEDSDKHEGGVGVCPCVHVGGRERKW